MGGKLDIAMGGMIYYVDHKGGGGDFLFLGKGKLGLNF